GAHHAANRPASGPAGDGAVDHEPVPGGGEVLDARLRDRGARSYVRGAAAHLHLVRADRDPLGDGADLRRHGVPSVGSHQAVLGPTAGALRLTRRTTWQAADG